MLDKQKVFSHKKPSVNEIKQTNDPGMASPPNFQMIPQQVEGVNSRFKTDFKGSGIDERGNQNASEA